MKRTFANFWQKPEKEETVENGVSPENLSPVDKAMSNLIKMKEATRLLRASAPTVRKYARMGHYKEYHFGEKLVFYDKEEILNFILNRSITPQANPMKEENKDSGRYIRVATTLYKIVRRPLMSGDFIEERRVWNYETLRQDHSKDFISLIEKYDGFCSVPDYINY